MALLQMATAVTQPRAPGQSSFGKIMEGASGAANYYATENQRLQDRAIAQGKDQRAMQLADQQLQNQRIANVRSTQEIVDTEERRPLQLQALQQSLDNAKTEGELKAVQLRLEKLNELYAGRVRESALSLQAAQTDESRARATMEKAHAEDFAKHSATLLEIANNKLEMARAALAAKGEQAAYHPIPGLPGEPDRLIDQKSGRMFYAPMSPADAVKYAKRQVAANTELSGKKLSDAETMAQVRELAAQFMKGTVPTAPGAESGVSAPGATPSATPTYPKGQTASTMADMMVEQAKAESAKDLNFAKKVIIAGQPRYFIGGKEVDQAEVLRRANGAKAGGGAPVAPAAPAAGPSPATSLPASSPAAAGPISQEIQMLKAQIASLVLAAQDPRMGVNDRVKISGTLAGLQQRLNQLEGTR
jgi:hypothetical protein